MAIVKKRAGYELQMATKIGNSGNKYLFIKDTYGAYHVFIEIEAKTAAKDCGAETIGKNTRQTCAAVCGF